MTIHYVGAEDIDFVATSNLGVSTNSSLFRPGYARVAMQFGDSATGDPNNFRAQTPQFASPLSSFWVSVRITQPFNGSANYQFLSFLDPSGVRRLIIRGTGTTNGVGTFKLSTRNAAGVITDIGTFPGTLIFSGPLTKIDAQIDYSAAGSVTLYSNGVSLGTVSGNLLTDSATSLQAMEVGSCSNFGWYFSELIVSSTSTLGMSLVTLTSSVAGDAQQWTGAPSSVNQTTLNDANFIYSSTPGQIQQYKPGSLPVGLFTVSAVVISARALKGGLGPQSIQYVTRVGATDYTPLASVPLTIAFANYQGVIPQNPAQGSSWSTADLASFQYGLKSVA